MIKLDINHTDLSNSRTMEEIPDVQADINKRLAEIENNNPLNEFDRQRFCRNCDYFWVTARNLEPDLQSLLLDEPYWKSSEKQKNLKVCPRCNSGNTLIRLDKSIIATKSEMAELIERMKPFLIIACVGFFLILFSIFATTVYKSKTKQVQVNRKGISTSNNFNNQLNFNSTATKHTSPLTKEQLKLVVKMRQRAWRGVTVTAKNTILIITEPNNTDKSNTIWKLLSLRNDEGYESTLKSAGFNQLKFIRYFGSSWTVSNYQIGSATMADNAVQYVTKTEAMQLCQCKL